MTATLLAISPARRGPTHIVVRGADPMASNLAGYAIASAFDPQFGLLEVWPGPAGPAPGDIPWGELIPPERHLIAFGPEGAPPESPAAQATWPLVRSDRAEEVLSNLGEFLAAPEASEQVLRRRFPMRPSALMLIANGWRVTRHFPDDPAVTGRLMEVQKRFGVSVVLTSDGTQRRDLVVFDAVFDVLRSDGPWGATRLRCTRAPVGADLRGGDEFALDEIEGFPAALARLAAKLPLSGADATSEAVPKGPLEVAF